MKTEISPHALLALAPLETADSSRRGIPLPLRSHENGADSAAALRHDRMVTISGVVRNHQQNQIVHAGRIALQRPEVMIVAKPVSTDLA
ncbi:hypothetical protein D3C80_1517270 [compost metagenome]